MDDERDGEEALSDRRAYKAIERALWAAAPLIFLALILGFPAIWQSRRQASAALTREIAAANASFCDKWGMPTGSAAHTACLRDLMRLQAWVEQRCRDDVASDF